MVSIDTIRESLNGAWLRYEQRFAALFEASDPLLRSALVYVHQRKGKQIRPIITLLCAKIVGEIGENTHLAAVALEAIHTASLLHDDVVDASAERRGKPSVNAKFDNRTAVLVGDYLLTKSIECMVQTHDSALIECLVSLGQEVTRGELLQLQNAYQPTSEEDYYEIIGKKTAALFAACTKAGAISAGASECQREALQAFGTHIGICFQIKDDIFDYTRRSNVGKPTLNDIREGKFSLPIIHALEQADSGTRERLYEMSKNHDFIEKNGDFLYRFVEQNGGLSYARKRMVEFRDRAVCDLSIFADSIEKNALLELLDFVLERDQ